MITELSKLLELQKKIDKNRSPSVGPSLRLNKAIKFTYYNDRELTRMYNLELGMTSSSTTKILIFNNLSKHHQL